jgi:hypothetical protein
MIVVRRLGSSEKMSIERNTVFFEGITVDYITQRPTYVEVIVREDFEYDGMTVSKNKKILERGE